MSELSENYFLHLGLTVFPATMFIVLMRKEFLLKTLSHLNCLHLFLERFSSSSFPISMLICFKTTVQKELGKLRDALAISKIPTTHFFYKQQFYKQYQAKVGKKSIKSLATPWGCTLLFENYSYFPSMLSSKINVRYSKKCAKNNCRF